jgi:hypothetical protein
MNRQINYFFNTSVLYLIFLLFAILFVGCGNVGGNAGRTDVASSLKKDDRLVNPGQRRYDQIAWLGTHNSYSDKGRYGPANQNLSVPEQLNEGVRYIQFDVWLVRQKFVSDSLEAEVYTGPNTEPRDKDKFGNTPLQVVAAHGDATEVVDLTLLLHPKPGKRLQDLENAFREVADFLSGIGRETVVTITLESHVHEDTDNQQLIKDAIKNSGLEARRFYLQKENPEIPVPSGQLGGWVVRRYGMPSIQLMTQYGKNLVIIPYNAPLNDEYVVRTVDGDDSVDPDKWTNAKNQNKDDRIDNFEKEIFRVSHSALIPTEIGAKNNNSYPTLGYRKDDIIKEWHRIPNLVSFDFVDQGVYPLLGLQNWSTRYFTNVDLEELWNETITPDIKLDHEPSANGWYNTDVNVLRMSAVEMPVQKAVASSWKNGDPVDPNPPDYGMYVPKSPDPETPVFPTFTEEGRYTFGFCVIDSMYGRRSTHMLVPIWIDKTPPELSLEADLKSQWPPNGKLFAVKVSGTATDNLSGFSEGGLTYRVKDEYGIHEPSGSFTVDQDGNFSFSVDLVAQRHGSDKDGRTYSIEVAAKDKADNQTVEFVKVTIPHDQRDHTDGTK